MKIHKFTDFLENLGKIPIGSSKRLIGLIGPLKSLLRLLLDPNRMAPIEEGLGCPVVELESVETFRLGLGFRFQIGPY